MLLEGFDSYGSDEELAKTWYRPHGCEMHQTLSDPLIGDGKSMKITFRTVDNDTAFYAAICRMIKWDLSDYTAAQYWLKPDGKGHGVTFEFNIANNDGENIHDLWSLSYALEPGDTSARLVTIPFADLQHVTRFADAPDVSPVFKPEAIIELSLYVAGREQREFGESTYVFDAIRAVSV